MLEISPGKKKIIKQIDRVGNFFRLSAAKSIPDPSEIRNILITEPWQIGDLVFITSGLKGIRALYPQAKIVLLAKHHSKELLLHAPWPDEIIPFNFPWTRHEGKYLPWRYPWIKLIRLFSQLRRRNFDLALDARMDFRNNLILWISGAENRIGIDEGGGTCFLTHILHHDFKLQHRVELWRFVLNQLGLKKTFSPGLFLSPEEKEWASQWMAGNFIDTEKTIIGVHPGAGHPLRSWKTERFIQVMYELNQQFPIQWVVFGEAKLASADTIAEAVPASKRMEGNLRQMMALIASCDLMLLNDSGPAHIAAALEVPVIAIFGPQLPERYRPWGSGHQVVFSPGIDCRPCQDRCQKTAPVCMEHIKPEDVTAVVTQWIRNHTNTRTAPHSTHE